MTKNKAILKEIYIVIVSCILFPLYFCFMYLYDITRKKDARIRREVKINIKKLNFVLY